MRPDWLVIFAATTCPPSPVLEKSFYTGPAEIASAAYDMVTGGAKPWTPHLEKAALAYQSAFRGPF